MQRWAEAVDYHARCTPPITHHSPPSIHHPPPPPPTTHRTPCRRWGSPSSCCRFPKKFAVLSFDWRVWRFGSTLICGGPRYEDCTCQNVRDPAFDNNWCELVLQLASMFINTQRIALHFGMSKRLRRHQITLCHLSGTWPTFSLRVIDPCSLSILAVPLASRKTIHSCVFFAFFLTEAA
jgi:hypothetical protein